jgi:hypothetical protein
MITQKYKSILDKLEPYLFCNSRNTQEFNLKPLGIEIKQELIFDCMKTESAQFFDLITKMDNLTFGDQGMGMDRWVLYDCSAMPGAIFGLAIRVNELESQLREKMNIPSSYQGYVPLSMYIAIPTAQPKHWFGHNLSSLNGQLENKIPGLGLLTKAMGILTMKIEKQYGATQWNNPALCIHAKLAPLELLTSYTPIHTHKYSLTYLAHYSEQQILDVLNNREVSRPTQSFSLSGDDKEQIQKIQKEIEIGDKFWICEPPTIANELSTYSIYKEDN